MKSPVNVIGQKGHSSTEREASQSLFSIQNMLITWGCLTFWAHYTAYDCYMRGFLMIEQTGIDLGLGVIRTITVRQIKRNTKPRVMSVGSFMYDQHDYREGLAACLGAPDLF